MKPVDQAVLGTVSERPGRNESERIGGPESANVSEAEPSIGWRKQQGDAQAG